ncbi:HIV Tat-specific factor 1 [Galleria mellonella]|uniref:HIV Tat-specific factor 1 n=1 Tax=Galleria mellonella TaxID=7137 RepID=A0A6J1WGI9_GALME|nr:HIV Tat-specific factor 1 [Galleria mellonella]
MSRQEKSSKPGFVIKLSCETVQKLSEEDQQPKEKSESAISAHTDNLSVSKSEEKPKQIEDNFIVSQNTETKSELNVDPKDTDDNLRKNVKNLENEEELLEQNKISNTDIIDTDKKDNSKGNATAWGDYAPYITFEGVKAIYTDPSTQQKYVWDETSNSWTPKSGQDVPGRVYSYENDTHVYTEQDGSKFFWDEEKKAWIPKVDDDFLALYQMSYGFVDNTPKEESKEEMVKKEAKKKADATSLKRKNEPQWFEPSEETNTKVYVSNLPLDITEEDFVNFMQKCGLVERDPSTQKMKVKLYMDKEQNCFKGDALCTYIKIESVDLALKLLDGSDFKGHKVKVERAHFQLKGEYNPALKPKKKKKKELEKIKKMQQKLFDWRPEKFIGERSKHERVVIVKNLFQPTDFDKDVQLILDYQQDLREESSKCGEVRKVVIYDRHPEGVAQITMKEPAEADAVVQLINGRWFGKRQITAEIWDGRTKYRIAETDADISKRIDKWDKFLEGKEDQNKESKPEDKNNEKESSEQSNVVVSPEMVETKKVA